MILNRKRLCKVGGGMRVMSGEKNLNFSLTDYSVPKLRAG